MKKLLLLLFLSFGFAGSTFALAEPDLDFSADTFCEKSPKVQVRVGLFYLPNQAEPYSGENLCIYTNGQYASHGDINKGLKEGKWTFWLENGQVDGIYNHSDGNLVDGTEYKYYDDGQKLSEQIYKYGILNGKWTTLNGKWTIWKSNGQIYTIDNYEKSFKPSRTKFEYYVNGQKKLETNIQDGKSEGRRTEWYETGQKKKEANYKDDILNGRIVWWYENGQKTLERSYKDGNLNGNDTRWHENGQKQLEVNWKDNKKFGLWVYWNEKGQKLGEGNYKDDKKNGWWTVWDKNGQMLSEGNYKDDKKNDWWTAWYINGQISSSGNYKNNLKDGWWDEWEENGQKAPELNYIEGMEEAIYLETITRAAEAKAIEAIKQKELAEALSVQAIAMKEVVEQQLLEEERKLEKLKAEITALKEKFEDEQNIRVLITEIQAEEDADRRQVFEGILKQLKENYIGLLAGKVRKEWRYQGAEDNWGCDVRIIQSEVGNVLAVNIRDCTIDNSDKAISFKNSIERAVYKASPLPLAPHKDLFSSEILFRFRVN